MPVEGPRPAITLSRQHRRNIRLCEKKGGRAYQAGEVASPASHRKGLCNNISKGITIDLINILSIIPDNMLFDFAQICRVHLGEDYHTRNQNLGRITSNVIAKNQLAATGGELGKHCASE